ncbi:hypothetical protein ACFC7B_04085 [Enterococcus gallinarum]|uniref:hypothetical protein n=1 Tax=Enterococcus gallinarum TaxID=1353 RepID=UPI0035D5D6C5
MIKTVATAQGTVKAYYKNVLIEYKRVQNDIYGNPLYKVMPVNFSWRKVYHAYRNYKPSYTHNGYYLLQSYNIQSDIQTLAEEIAAKIDFPQFDETLLTDYKDVKTLQDFSTEKL